MSIYHCSIKNIGRSSGKSAVASSSYRSGERLVDHETGIIHDFGRKSGIVYSEVMLCENAPKEYQQRENLWNEVQKIEKAKDARLAREIEVAIPKEFSREQQIETVREYVKNTFVADGMCADFSIHDKEDGNPHAHIMLTTRPIKENGKWGSKEKKAYALDPFGNKIPVLDKETGLQKIGKKGDKQWKRITVESNEWNKKEKVELWREQWAVCCNHHLEKEKQIDHRSYERQGIEQLPTKHEGWYARKLDKDGKQSWKIERNEEIKSKNTLLDQIKEELKKLAREMKEITEKRKGAIDDRIGELLKRRETSRHLGRDAGGDRGKESNHIGSPDRDIEQELNHLESSRRSTETQRRELETARAKQEREKIKKQNQRTGNRGFDMER